ncbi:MAG: rhodanese-like domain-containing protein [Rhodospirillales bacterium]
MGGAGGGPGGTAGRLPYRCRVAVCRHSGFAAGGQAGGAGELAVFPERQRERGTSWTRLRDAGLDAGQKIFFLCRSGARSMAAALAARAEGFAEVYNVADGFEGPQDPEGHRGLGWRGEGGGAAPGGNRAPWHACSVKGRSARMEGQGLCPISAKIGIIERNQ